MKLIGKCNAIETTVAKRTDDGITQKRRFKIQVRPASKVDSYYGYGDMNFILNGRELEDFGVQLDDDLEIFVVKAGEDAPSRQIDDVSRLLYDAENKITDLEKKLTSNRAQELRDAATHTKYREQNGVLMAENVRLATENQVLKQRLADQWHGENMKVIPASEGAA